MTARFPLSPRARSSLSLVGREQEPVLTIDDVLVAPRRLVEAAGETIYAPAWGPGGGYPGLRGPAPLDYVEGVSRALLPVLVEAFALPPVRLRHAECSFSLVTLSPDRLHATQRAPHVDTSNPWQFAILHYLCDPAFGGTAFYRHRATGFETLTPEREVHYASIRADEPDGDGYVAGGAPWFDAIGAVDAAFDRIAVYRSRLLHSGIIAAPDRLSDDPTTGRLTANIFLTLRPQK